MIRCQLCGEQLRGFSDSRVVGGAVVCMDGAACNARPRPRLARLRATGDISDSPGTPYRCPTCEIERKPEGGGKIRCIR
jgi:hypothetical protein